mgnify:CR=1 FL=1
MREINWKDCFEKDALKQESKIIEILSVTQLVSQLQRRSLETELQGIVKNLPNCKSHQHY